MITTLNEAEGKQSIKYNKYLHTNDIEIIKNSLDNLIKYRNDEDFSLGLKYERKNKRVFILLD